MVTLTVVDNMLSLCFAGTAMRVLVFIIACTEYNLGRTVDGDEAKIYLLTVSMTI